MLKSIDDLKGSIKKRGGLAMQNRFNVIFNPPSQSFLNTSGRGLINTLIAGGSLKSLINDPREMSLLAVQATLPGRQITTGEHQTYKETKKYVTNFIDEEVALEFHITQDYYMKTIFDNWQKLVFDTDKYRVNFKQEYTADVIIQQLDKEKNLPVYGVKLINAFPTTVAGVPLNNETENTTQKLNVTLSYDKFEIDDALGTLGEAARSVVDRVINII